MGMISYSHVHLTRDASKSRNGYVHPMIPFLLAIALSCEESQQIIDGITDSRVVDKTELIQVVKTHSEKGCRDAND